MLLTGQWINITRPRRDAPRASQITPRAFQITPRAFQIAPRAFQIAPRAFQIAPRASHSPNALGASQNHKNLPNSFIFQLSLCNFVQLFRLYNRDYIS